MGDLGCGGAIKYGFDVGRKWLAVLCGSYTQNRKVQSLRGLICALR